jgi:hypothetical protein
VGLFGKEAVYLYRNGAIFLSLPPIVEVIFGLRVDMKDVRMNIAFGGEGYPAGSLVNDTNVVSEV